MTGYLGSNMSPETMKRLTEQVLKVATCVLNLMKNALNALSKMGKQAVEGCWILQMWV